MNVSDCAFHTNQAVTMNGGAIAAWKLGNFSIEPIDDRPKLFNMQKNEEPGKNNGTMPSFLRNSAGGNGGAMFVSDAANMTIRASNIKGNRANQGGGVYITGAARLQVVNSTLQANNATIGGGLRVTGSKSLAISKSDLLRNFAQQTGGGVALMDVSGVKMVGTQIVENSAYSGAGIQLEGGTGLVAEELVLDGNSATKEGGGLTCSDKTIVNMSHSTFHYNYAPTAGSIFAACSCNITAERCAFYRDKERKSNGDFFLNARKCTWINTEHCTFKGGPWKLSLPWLVVTVCVLAALVSIGVGSIRICVVALKKRKKRQERAAAAPLLGPRPSDDELTESSWYSSSYSDVSDEFDIETGTIPDKGPSTTVQSRSLGPAVEPAGMSREGSKHVVASASQAGTENGSGQKPEMNDIETEGMLQTSVSEGLEGSFLNPKTSVLMSPKVHSSTDEPSECFVKVELRKAPGIEAINLVIIPCFVKVKLYKVPGTLSIRLVITPLEGA